MAPAIPTSSTPASNTRARSIITNTPPPLPRQGQSSIASSSPSSVLAPSQAYVDAEAIRVKELHDQTIADRIQAREQNAAMAQV